jgi:translation initiation factor 1
MSKKKNNRIDVVYSTNPNFSYEIEQEEEQDTLEPKDQLLYVSIDRKNRGGKEATLVEGFVGTHDDLSDLAKTLKSKCGVGGSAKDGVIIIQGNFKQKVADMLTQMSYRIKLKGGN